VRTACIDSKDVLVLWRLRRGTKAKRHKVDLPDQFLMTKKIDSALKKVLELDEDTNLESILEDTSLTAVEKAQLLADAGWSFQR